MDTSNQTYRILEDSPTGDDDFQSHEKIADAIGRIIQENDGGKTVGLEGEWGSGKSSIIKILQRKFGNDETHFFFSFDAWVHQGDPLRRAFLESLISNAIDGGWLNDKSRSANENAEINDEWRKRRDELSSRVKTVVKNTQPDVAGFPKWLLLSLIFSPLGTALLIGVLAKYSFHINLSSWPLPIPDWFFLLGVAIVIFPFLIFAAGLIFHIKNSTGRTKLWVALLQKNHVSETIHTVESLDASTLEFQTLFGKFMDQLLNEDRKKVVIVLDNMDRLPPDEGMEVWPVLRSFIDNPVFSSSAWAKRLWVLIPYARGTLTEPESKSHNDSDASAPTEKADSEKPLLTAEPHFLDKVFQITIFVPPPVLSNWRAFLEKLLNAAFGNRCDAIASHTIYLLFARCFRALQTPRPREIKRIINGMIATSIQWPTEIPLCHHAYFAILKHRERSGELRNRLIERDLPLHEDLLGENVAESLVALEYNVHPKIGAQMLYEPVIRRIFSKKSNLDELLSQCEAPGFAAQFDILIGKVLCDNSESDPLLFADNMLTLCAPAFFEKASPSSRRNIIREIAKATEKLKYFPLHLNELVEVIETLIEADSDKLAAASLARAIKRTAIHFSGSNHRGVFGFSNSQQGDELVLNRVHRLKSSDKLSGYAPGISVKFAFPGSLGDFERITRYYREKGKLGVLDIFDVTGIKREFSEEVTIGKGANRRLSETISLLKFFLDREITFPDEFYTRLTRKMIGDRSSGYESARISLPYLIALSSKIPAAKEALMQADSEGFVCYYLGVYNPRLPSEVAHSQDTWLIEAMNEDEKNQVCANLIYLTLLSDRATGQVETDEISKRGQKFFRRIIAKPQNHEGIFRALDGIFVSQPGSTLGERSSRDDLLPLYEFLENRRRNSSVKTSDASTATYSAFATAS